MGPTAVLAAQVAGTFDYVQTSRLDARATQPLPQAPTPPPREIALAADASFTPVARLRVTDRRWEYTLSYSPTFTVTDVELTSSAQPVVLNAGTVTAAWHDRLVRVLVSEGASFGWENLAYLYATPVAGQPLAAGQSQAPGQTTGQTGGLPGPTSGPTSGQAPGQNGTAQTVPLSHVFPFGSSNTSASLQLRATRSVTLIVSGGYSLSGDLTNSALAKEAYPEQFGPSAAASVVYASSPANSFVTMASAQQTTTPMGVCPFSAASPTISPVSPTFCREVTPVLSLKETARRRLSPTETVSAGLGVSASIYQLASGTAWGILPIGEVTYSKRFGLAPKDPREQIEADGLRLSASLESTVNIFTGSPSNRLQLSGSLVHRVAPWAALSTVAGALQTVPVPHPDPSPLTVVNGGGELRVRVTRSISVSLGVQAFWQTQQNVGALPSVTTGQTTTTSEVGYVALTVRTPRERL